MKNEVLEVLKCKYAARNICKKGVFLLPLTLLVVVVLLLITNINESFSSYLYAGSLESCDIFSGNWIGGDWKGAYYYSNESCPFIAYKQNCFMHGRPDREFLKWRWKPDQCELPLFDAKKFLRLVRGKSMAFVGDSIGRNQMESLLCLLNTVSRPEDITGRYTSDKTYFKWWFFADYKFTVAILWSPFLVKSSQTYLNDKSFYNAENLYVDEADKAWASHIENFDYVIFSCGQWFFRPLTFYENGKVVGCQKCHNLMEDPLNLYGYRHAFRTAFRTVINLKGFKGMVFMVTHSPNHFENGEWNKGGGCNRTVPVTKEESGYLRPYGLQDLYHTQVEEFSAAEKEARDKGLRFGLMNITGVMLMRPDGHPHKYGHSFDTNQTVNDCVHWCMPGPVDTWNQFLLHMIKNQRL